MVRDTSTIVSEKAGMREAALARRDALNASDRAAAAQAIAARGLPLMPAPGAVISGFSAMRSEINPVPLMRRLADDGYRLALPCVTGREQPLTFRAWNLGEPLLPGVWGIREPAPSAPAIAPDILLVPLAAFDRRGFRIGYGGGYYDRSLKQLRVQKAVTAIGLAFSAQEVSRVPQMPYDEPLDIVLTERETIDCRDA